MANAVANHAAGPQAKLTLSINIVGHAYRKLLSLKQAQTAKQQQQSARAAERAARAQTQQSQAAAGAPP